MSGQRHRRQEIESRDALIAALGAGTVAGHVLQAVDVSGVNALATADVRNTVFLGCTFSGVDQERALEDRGATVFHPLDGVPFKVWRRDLYSVDELLEGYKQRGYVSTRDFQIYAHYDRERRHPQGAALRELLAQRLHDLSIDDALHEALADSENSGIVGIMGGHGTPRTAASYRQAAATAWHLTRAGCLVVTGGGPGTMEAGNLGAWLGCYSDLGVLDAALEVMGAAATFSGGAEEGTSEYLAAIDAYFATAKKVVERFGAGVDAETAARFGRDQDAPGKSLAIPTWFYGHEPTNLFANQVAKYFSNALREDGLLAIATGGVVFAPGSAGTL
ncbi:hypothetical protein OAX78_03665, partial [Planctomycetota bacterium]|nr:hypothetical protein [Planctomycetota bacterium]